MEISKTEMRTEFEKMKMSKVTGPDEISIVNWKCLCEEALEFLTMLFNKILNNGEIPDELRKITLLPVFKSIRGLPECCNYRGIKLWEGVMETTLKKRLQICKPPY